MKQLYVIGFCQNNWQVQTNIPAARAPTIKSVSA